MATVNIKAEEMIRDHVKYYLDNVVDDELNKFILEAQQNLEKKLRDTAARAALTLVRNSRVEMAGSEITVRLELPDPPKKEKVNGQG